MNLYGHFSLQTKQNDASFGICFFKSGYMQGCVNTFIRRQEVCVYQKEEVKSDLQQYLYKIFEII